MQFNFPDILAKSPFIKTTIFVFSNIVSGILTTVYITDISPLGKIQWALSYHFASFYFLIALVVLILAYNIFMYNKEVDILNFKDEGYCKAYVRSACLPEAVAQYKERMKKGDMEGLKDISAEIKRISK